MLKKTSDILIFLCKNDTINNETLKVLWNSTLNKHEST